MGVLQLILLVIQVIGAIPGLLRALKEIQDWIRSQRDPAVRARLKGELAIVLTAAKEQKDPQPILDYRNRCRENRRRWLTELREESSKQ